MQALLDAVLSIESDLDLGSLLRRIISVAVDLVDATYGALGVIDPGGHGLERFVHVGMDPEAVRATGHLPEGRGVLGTLIVRPEPIRLRRLSDHPDSVGFPPGHPSMRSFLGVPVMVGGRVYGNLYLTDKKGADEFSAADEALVSALGVAAGIAIDNARLHAQVRELSVAEDRDRIARDLHDTVIQRVFAVGLSLQGLVGRVDDPEVRSRIETAVSDLDETVRQVRTAIFALGPPPSSKGGLRAQVLEVCSEAARSLGSSPELRFDGALEVVPTAVRDSLLAVVREALSNIARHAHASRAEVQIRAGGEDLELVVRDDGVGLAHRSGDRGHGLTNMASRAKELGGTFAAGSGPDGGTELRWRVPIS